MQRTDIATSPDAGTTLERVSIEGDLSVLSPQERVQYYAAVCRSVGLNPLTRPFGYIRLNNQLRLYAYKDCTDQLRKINAISLEIAGREIEEGVCVVRCKASDKTNRSDEDYGAVWIDGLKGEARANAILKAITKAKRRVTLSISGLGFLDETEVDDIPREARGPVAIDTAAELDQFAHLTGEAEEPPPYDAKTDKPLPRSTIWQDDSYQIKLPMKSNKEGERVPDWGAWAGHIRFLVTEATAAELDKLQKDNKDLFNQLRLSDASDAYRSLGDAITARREQLT